jgi:hypothetical protein
MPISAQHTKFIYPDYISPLPADDLLKFAQKKQEMYDEGVFKIQQNLDTYNSLRSSILTDVEKEYFDKSMGNLVKSISSSAGLDFSNKANVQAVLNVGKPLERDQYITTAISNGKEVARRQDQLTKMKPGERSVVNDFYYMQDVQNYMKSGKLGQKIGYGKEYTPYVDLSKDWMEFMKTQKPDQEESFNMNSGFGPAYIEKVTEEGYNTTDLANKFKSFIASDPNKVRQFQMDAGYSLEQVGTESAHQGYVEDMQAKATTAAKNAQLFKAETDRLQKVYDTTGSATVKAQLEQTKQRAVYYEQSRLLAQQKAATTLEDFDLGEYMEIYEDMFATNMGNMYATKKVSRDLISNEYWKEARADARQTRAFQNDLIKEEYKQKLERQKPENLLKQKKELMSMAKVDQQDFYNVPMMFDINTTNLDIDKLSISEILSDPSKVLNVTPSGPQKAIVTGFLNYLKEVKDIDSYIVELKSGETMLVTGENIKDLYVSDLDTIKSMARSNTVETYSGRRKANPFLTAAQQVNPLTDVVEDEE